MHKAIFIDRDGTVSEEVGYMYHAGLFRPFPWTGAAIRRINESGMKAVLTTNQSGIERGYFSEDIVLEVHGILRDELSRWKAHLDAFYYCPHRPESGCNCRKPRTGMLFRAQQELDVDLGQSFVIGDRYIDVQMARAAGAKSVLVLTGDGRKELLEHGGNAVQPDHVAGDLLRAVEAILNGEVS